MPPPFFGSKSKNKNGCITYKLRKQKCHDKKIIITCHLFRNSGYNILERDNCFFIVIIVFCNFLADYKAQKKTVITKKKQLSRIMDPN